jgi:hypothetical protein
MRALRRLRVDEHTEHGVSRLHRQHRLQQACRVAVAAGARVVLRIRQHGRSSNRSALHRAPHRLFGREELQDELLLGVRDALSQRGHRGLQSSGIGAVTAERHSARFDVGHRKAGGERQRDTVSGFELLKQGVNAATGFDQGAL